VTAVTKDISIRSRLALWYTAVLSLGLVLFSCTVWLGLRQTLRVDLATMLENQARGLEEYLRIEEQDEPVDLRREIEEYSKSWLQDHLLIVYDDRKKLIYSNTGGGSGSLATAKLSSSPEKPRKLVWKYRRYLSLNRNIPLKTGTLRAFLAVSSAANDRAVNLLGWLLVLAVPLFIACGAAGGYWLSRRALLPIDRITERARTIGVSNLSERLEVPHTNDQLQRLTETWNGMLERLEAAVLKISRFTADASHELRTPVAIIRLAAENALRRPRSEAEYQAALQDIQRESASMTQLIGDLLFLTRGDVEMPLESESVFVDELVRNVCADLSPLASMKSIALTQNLPEKAVMVSGNSPALRRMLLVLLDNAIKYTPEGGHVSVHLKQDHERVVLRVEDNGIGIPEEAKSHVFERFFRVDPSRSKESGGYGLGLAIARAIVQQHNASIEIQSSDGGGSVFSVSLPTG
jgi:two-component system, OmpR family, heavy metal sensor histidine kinase CusS